MIELKELRKSYKTGDFVQKALDGVSLNLRDNEFVAILGPSGSGKTTLLNVLGGLDHADTGDIVINGTSTKDYSSKDWDTYRNHRIGFIFQSYNLIPHQTVLANVELALTLSGVSRAERKERARAALEMVGLGKHVNKRPSQLSGGQMQRVAIARALVNDPEIVLADEPTGALDTETGVQIMDILKNVASDRLVVMVTHNPELAEQYATRIVRLADGRIIDDNDPFDPKAGIGVDASRAHLASPVPDAREAAKGTRKASMSFLTALGLSFNNLMTKKGRTFLTAFAGSIGIIGIAAILALSNGTNNYIADTEEEALSSYPLTITKSSFDMTNLLSASAGSGMDTPSTGSASDSSDGDSLAGDSVIPQNTIMGDMFAQVKNNDLSAFKAFLDSGESGIEPYVNTIKYDYAITPQIFSADTSEGVEQLNPGSMQSVFSNGINSSSLFASSMTTSIFQEMLDDQDLIESQMDVVRGRWPQSYDEAVLVLSHQGTISDYTLYSMGIYDPEEMKKMTQDALNGNEVTVPKNDDTFTYDDAMGMTFKVVPKANMYTYSEDAGSWTDRSDDEEYMKQQIANGIDLKIVGIVKAKDTATTTALSEGVAYTPELTRRLMAAAADSEIVQKQKDNPDVDVFTGKSFEELQDGQSQEFDMSQVFTVDEDALASAFSFDTSALSNANMGDLDLSGLDMSSLASSMDPSQMDTSALSSAFNAETMAKILQGAPQPDLDMSKYTLSPAQQQAIADAQGALQQGFLEYVMDKGGLGALSDPDALRQAYGAYLATPKGQEAQKNLQEASAGAYEATIQAAMNDYMQNQFAPYMANQMQAIMTQAAQAMANQMSQQMAAQMAVASQQMGTQLSQAIGSQLSNQMSALSDSLANGFSVDADAFANAIQVNMSQEDLTSLLTNYMNADDLTYDGNMKKLGYAEESSPESISIYPIDFPAKESVLGIIDGYNQRMEDAGNEDAAIQYTDVVGTLMTSVTRIVDTISLVLIAFVSISLVVSSIMIAIITYISVLERKKEIGILRAMGASKMNVANVFNAETIIEGLIAGVFAILVVYIASVPVNAFVLAGWNVPNVMSLPPVQALILIGISVALTFIAGLIPSSMASRRDPVEALRSE